MPGRGHTLLWLAMFQKEVNASFGPVVDRRTSLPVRLAFVPFLIFFPGLVVDRRSSLLGQHDCHYIFLCGPMDRRSSLLGPVLFFGRSCLFFLVLSRGLRSVSEEIKEEKQNIVFW